MQDYKKLDIWKKAMDYTTEIYKMSSKLPPSEKYGLTSQIQRAICSIPLNIAEGAGCESQKEFKLFSEYAHRYLLQKEKEIRAMIHALVRKL